MPRKTKVSETSSADARRRLAPADFAALAEFRHALRKFTAFSEAAATASGLTPQQHQAMLAIKGSGPDETLSVGEIAERLLIRHHSAVELVDRLEKMGLAERRPDPRDRRRVLVGLTGLAEQRLEALSSAHFDELRAIGPLLRRLLAHFD